MRQFLKVLVLPLILAAGLIGPLSPAAAVPAMQVQTSAPASTASAVVANYRTGATLSTAGSSATFAVAAGTVSDSTNAVSMVLASALSKTTSAWAVGTGNGALDTGSIANNTWYHVFIIERLDTGVVEVLISTSLTPSLPSNYTVYRRIGSMKTNGSGQWIKFVQVGNLVLWAAPVASISTTTLGTTATLFALETPPGIQVVARLRGRAANTSAGANILVNSPDETAAVPDAVLGNVTAVTQVSGVPVGFAIDVRTDTSQQVRAVADVANTVLRVAVVGYIDPLGQ